MMICINISTHRYTPPVLWGYNGHIQAHIYGAIGRFSPPQPKGLRYRRTATDGATVTFDVFHPASSSTDHPLVLVVPGIANGSDKAYIRVLVSELNKLDYIVIVLNHLGAIDNEQLTSRRIFTYGGTDDLQLVMDLVVETWPGKPIVGLGLSMGGNVLMKYLGEKPDRQKNFIGAVTVCQGYNILKAWPTWMTWRGLRRLYNYYITRKLLVVVKRHHDVLFTLGNEKGVEWSGQNSMASSQPDMKRTLSATSVTHVDTHLQKHLVKFNTLEEYYDQQSCCHHLHKITNIPVLLLNALDDPIVVKELLENARNYASTSPNAMFVLTKHGSHMGYFEGGWLIPNTVTWLDRMLIQFTQAAESIHNSRDCKY
jgi:abhydrolase domain-containing protein 2